MKMVTAVIACLTLLSSAQAQWNPAKSISDAGKNISNAGKNAGKNISNAGKNVSNAGKNAGKNISNAGKNAGKNISNSTKQLESNIQHAPGKVHNSLSKKQQTHHKQSNPSPHDTKSTHTNPAEQKVGTHKTEQKLGTHRPGHLDSSPPVSSGQKTNVQTTASSTNGNVPVARSGVVGIDTNPQPVVTPGTPGFNESLIPWQDAYSKNRPVYNGQPAPARPGVVGLQIPPGGQGGGSGGTSTNKDGTQPPILQDPAGFGKVFLLLGP